MYQDLKADAVCCLQSAAQLRLRAEFKRNQGLGKAWQANSKQAVCVAMGNASESLLMITLPEMTNRPSLQQPPKKTRSMSNKPWSDAFMNGNSDADLQAKEAACVW